MFMPSILNENIFDSFFGDFSKPVRRFAGWNRNPFLPDAGYEPVPQIMKTDVKESENGYELSIDLPGYRKEDIQAQLKDGYLKISASSGQEKEEKEENGRFLRRERYFGSCSRSFYIGEDVKQEDIKAKFEDGILKVEVPKKQPEPELPENNFICIEG